MRKLKLNYFTLPDDTHIASVLKSGSSAVAKALLSKGGCYQDKMPSFIGKQPDNCAGWQMFVPKVSALEAKNPLILVRDPVERFCSAISQVFRGREYDINEILDTLESGEGDLSTNPHFAPTSKWLVPGTNRLFKLPEHLPEFAKEIGLTSIPAENVFDPNKRTKPELTEAQITRVIKLYKEDEALREQITEAGTIKDI